MIAELAAFNLAVATVKEAANHAGDIVSIFKGMGEMMAAKEKVDKVVAEKGQTDLEAYAAHVKMKQEYDQIIELLKWTGHYEPYMEFKRERRKEREAAEARARVALRKKREKIRDAFLIIILVVAVLAGVGILAGLIWLGKTQGRGL
jgi:hypothetical protein